MSVAERADAVFAAHCDCLTKRREGASAVEVANLLHAMRG